MRRSNGLDCDHDDYLNGIASNRSVISNFDEISSNELLVIQTSNKPHTCGHNLLRNAMYDAFLLTLPDKRGHNGHLYRIP